MVIDPSEELFEKLGELDFGRERFGIEFEKEEVFQLPDATDGNVHLTTGKVVVTA